MHTAGRAVDDTLAPELTRRLQHVERSADVHLTVVVMRMAGSAEHGGDVINLSATARGVAHIVAASQLTDARVDADAGELFGLRSGSHQRTDAVPLRQQAAGKMAAREAGRAGNEDLHRRILPCPQRRSKRRHEPNQVRNAAVGCRMLDDTKGRGRGRGAGLAAQPGGETTCAL